MILEVCFSGSQPACMIAKECLVDREPRARKLWRVKGLIPAYYIAVLLFAVPKMYGPTTGVGPSSIQHPTLISVPFCTVGIVASFCRVSNSIPNTAQYRETTSKNIKLAWVRCLSHFQIIHLTSHIARGLKLYFMVE